MGSIENISELCRLCLVKDQVNVPIFEENATKEQTFVKINSCLPVKVSRDDSLPKKICDGCSCKLDMLYTFRNTSVDSEKQLLKWLNQAGLSCSQSAVKDPLASTKPEVTIKQETFEPTDSRDDLGLDTHSYIMQQQKLPYSQEFEFGEPSESNVGLMTDEPAPKKAKRAAALNKASVETDEDDLDAAMQITKAEDEDSDEIDQPEYVEAPSTSADDQPGPSGVNKTTVEAPEYLEQMLKCKLPEVDIIPVKQQVRLKQTKTRAKPTLYKNPFVYTNSKPSNRKVKKRSTPENRSIKWACMICSDVKEDKQSLIEHYEFHKNETESLGLGDHSSGDYFLCPVCLTDFTSLKSYEKHVENQHGEKHFACDECNKFFKNAYQLCIHNYNMHSADKIYRCVMCNFTTRLLKSLRPHLKQKHEDEFKYRCEICNRGFASATWYEEHKNFHTGAMPFECEICFKSFPYTRYLIAHKKTMHPDVQSGSPATHECDICHKRFAHKKSLVLHIRGHTGENTVLCEMCGKSLSSSEHLKQHIRIHTGYKPHTCSVCGKSFAKKCNLTLHERVHSGEKPYVCSTCGKCFSQRSTLVIHQRYHSGERPYVCHLCNRGFVAKGLLGVHLKTCSGIPLD
ncbi:zinc finger protein ZFP2 isoform X2 [Tribolium castaneum]|nr:PREDICTED: zinc finger protein 2 isoform X2 [Tribolium castaneum]|eukprot:XP_015834115.1 PREDICTED: zinc finger protein 2 isoform X2 [Tribolium castaneum]